MPAGGPLKVAVLVSGRGSNLQSLIDACADSDFPAKIALVVSNKADAGGLERAKKANIPSVVLNHRDYPTREDFDAAMSAEIEKSGATLVCLAGFMRLLSESFVNRWHDRLVNIHPSLLPAFKGLDVHQRVIDSGARFSGCTVHYVRTEMDAGPIIAQAVVPVHPGDDEATLAARVLEQEHVIYPRALRLIALGRVRVDGDRTMIDGHVPPPGALTSPADS